MKARLIGICTGSSDCDWYSTISLLDVKSEDVSWAMTAGESQPIQPPAVELVYTFFDFRVFVIITFFEYETDTDSGYGYGGQ